MNGKVKFFDNEKKFGFILGDDNTEYFVHQSGLKEGTTIGEGTDVTFDVEQGDRGPKAVNVAVAGAEAPATEEAPAEATEEAPAEEAPAEATEEAPAEATEEAPAEAPAEEAPSEEKSE